MYNVMIVILLSFLSIFQYSCYSGMRKERDSIKESTQLHYERLIKNETDKYNKILSELNQNMYMVSTELEVERSIINKKFRDLYDERRKVIADPIYTDCNLTDDGMQLVEKARIAANSGKSTR